MRITYDSDAKASYIHLALESDVDANRMVDAPGLPAMVVLDFDAQGAVLGIEVLHGKRKFLPQALLRNTDGPAGTLVRYDRRADTAHVLLDPAAQSIKNAYHWQDEAGGRITFDFDRLRHLVRLRLAPARRLLPREVLAAAERAELPAHPDPPAR